MNRNKGYVKLSHTENDAINRGWRTGRIPEIYLFRKDENVKVLTLENVEQEEYRNTFI